MDKVDISIMRLQEASQMSQQIYGKPLVITHSGGKDSSVCLYLAQKANIPFEVIHNHTTADAPETVYFIKQECKRLEDCGVPCKIEYPIEKGKRTSMWRIIYEQGPSNRWSRQCCRILKENSVSCRFIVTGVRWAESKKRANTRGIYETDNSNKDKRIILNNDNDEKRMLFETCQLKAKRICNPIIDWTDRDIWDFIQSNHLVINPLYEQGEKRVGCIGCPMASTKERCRQFAKWPKYKQIYMIAFQKYIEIRKIKGMVPVRDTAEDVFHWWMEDGVLPGQIGLFDEEN